ncbi:Sec-independent protein translocase protein TatB [Methylocapsa sp. S129]|uniref:Sec-independent protein translocase protein TatB n=1 Tax=Methylocapsa sp. S129 TaxID=1641869 RepID=UPI00131AA779|nr:Sec-independent protein translocase protein TatB [Methylocapsa sp. S129]
MFDIDAGKILVVGVVALLVIGPKDLPRVLRTVGQTVGKMRRMASEFQNQFMEAIKEADLEDVKKEFTAIRDSANIDTSFDAASIMRDEITTAVEGPKEIGHSTVDLTGTGPMKEITAGPVDAAPQALGSLAAAESPLDPPKDAQSTALDLNGAGPMKEAASLEAPSLAPAESPVASKDAAPHGGEAAERADAAVSQSRHG